MQLTQHPEEAARRQSVSGIMALAEYGLKLEPGSFRPTRERSGAWALLAVTPRSIVLGYIKEGTTQ